jgi:hypothetical protein
LGYLCADFGSWALCQGRWAVSPVFWSTRIIARTQLEDVGA